MKPKHQYYQTLTKCDVLNAYHFENLDFREDLQTHLANKHCQFSVSEPTFGPTYLPLTSVSPWFLATKTTASKEDNPNWWQAMKGPYSEEYWKAAQVEISTLENMNAWEVVDAHDNMNVLPSTWAFKCKRYPDGTIKKFKGRFCARGDKQEQGIDYFETYSPVVHWVTIRLMFILECLLRLVSKQGDVTCAFLHAFLPEGENVYLKMPQGFRQYDK